ncbi:alginate lyase family protein [Sphingobacterium griseoflavum]|uniref:Alginate lyase domain-containing protein n=1 Tax=Sphingobacterium griseoflavum TaxID=1474952 RepID=A0ABQ3HVM9_9SPHI|nr:alginate lyase family protein [Sphingobacterium griseoflavum]GHE39144.1 hypothetical protein GCM10017764_22940 [Sphingobacterium griseoflavum]
MRITDDFGNSNYKIISFDYSLLKSNLAYVNSGGKLFTLSLNVLVEEANKLLTAPPFSVVDGDLPPSGDLHDFYSIGKLSWMNPEENNNHYVRRDGESNPEAFSDKYDLKRFERVLRRINILSLAFFFTSDNRYASKASNIIDVWFLNNTTRMNPNMNNASVQKGVNDGMAIGIIFTVSLIETLDHIQLLRTSRYWSLNKHKKMQQWVAQYTKWLESSKFGRQISKADNNHGSWFYAQVASYKLFSGNFEGFDKIFDEAKKHVSAQIEPDGRLPAEIERVSSFSYSVYGLRSFATLAKALSFAGYSLWTYKAPNHSGLERAFSFLAPYMLDKNAWPYNNGGKNVDDTSFSIWRNAYTVYKNPQHLHVYNHIVTMLKEKGDWRMLYTYYR